MRDICRFIVVAGMVLWLAACGGAPTGTAQPAATIPTAGSAAQPTAAPEPTGAPQPTAEPTIEPAHARPTQAAEPRPTSVGSAALVIYHKSGGIMGLDETLTVRDDGTLVFHGRGGVSKTIQVPAKQLDKLRALISSPDFGKLQAQYQAAGADLFTYDITVPGSTPAHVVTMDGVNNPAVLEQLIEQLNMLRKLV